MCVHAGASANGTIQARPKPRVGFAGLNLGGGLFMGEGALTDPL